MTGRLNLFQKTMLQWNELQPYNAVHVARLSGAPNLKGLGLAVELVLQRRGLTALALDRERGTFCYHGGSASPEIAIVDAGADPHLALEAEIQRRLNTPFAIDVPFLPFHFFVVPEPASFALGFVYFHVVADAEAVLRVFKEIVAEYLGLGTKAIQAPLNLHPPRFDNVLRHHPGVVARRLAGLPRFWRDMRRSSRPRIRNPDDFQQGFSLFSLEEMDFVALERASKDWGATIHDLWLAALLKGIAALSPTRCQARRRREISVGTIVNARRDLGLDGVNVFGLFLGSFVVTHPVPRGISLRQLTSDIREQTARIKSGRLYLGTPLELAAVRLVLPFFSTPAKRKFYQKQYPLWGGITNMNLNTLWPQRSGEPALLDYGRAVSTGPATPLVLSVTTLGRCVNIGLSYRLSAFSAEEIGSLKQTFLSALRHSEAPA